MFFDILQLDINCLQIWPRNVADSLKVYTTFFVDNILNNFLEF